MTFESETFAVTPDNVLYIPANSVYSRVSFDDENLIAIHFNIKNVASFSPMLIDTDNGKTTRIFMDIYNIWNSKKRGYRYKCTALLYDFLADAELEKTQSDDYAKIEKSLRYIENNSDKKIYVDSLAKMCNMCETQYRKIFKKEIGTSPVKYLNKLRINQAVSMLSSGYYSMAEISEMCGFTDQKYFNKIFKEETGKTPSQYRGEYEYDVNSDLSLR